MKFSTLAKRISEMCPEILRPSWLPVKKFNFETFLASFEEVQHNSFNTAGTKFGGKNPFRPKGFIWPKCVDCHYQKTFICQINIEDLHEDLKVHINRRDGLFQFFYCVSCTPRGGDDECFKDMNFVPREFMFPSLQALASNVIFKNGLNITLLPNVLQLAVLNYNEVFHHPKQTNYYGCEEIKVEWEKSATMEIPHIYLPMDSQDSLEIASVKAGADVTDDDLRSVCEDFYSELFDVASPVILPEGDVKLGGYINWPQKLSFPTCSDCELDMDITFLQIEREGHLFPYYINCGTIHVTLCPGCGRAGLDYNCD